MQRVSTPPSYFKDGTQGVLLGRGGLAVCCLMRLGEGGQAGLTTRASPSSCTPSSPRATPHVVGTRRGKRKISRKAQLLCPPDTRSIQRAIAMYAPCVEPWHYPQLLMMDVHCVVCVCVWCGVLDKGGHLTKDIFDAIVSMNKSRATAAAGASKTLPPQLLGDYSRLLLLCHTRLTFTLTTPLTARTRCLLQQQQRGGNPKPKFLPQKPPPSRAAF